MFALTSPTISEGGRIPERHAREGNNQSPQLDWTEPPQDTLSFVLVLDDPDAPTPGFKHWVVYDIPKDRRHLPAQGSSGAGVEALPHAVNDFGEARYDGPQPPPDHPPHTYRFRLAALNVSRLPIGEEPKAEDVWEAAREYMLAEAELTAQYGANQQA